MHEIIDSVCSVAAAQNQVTVELGDCLVSNYDNYTKRN